MKIIICVLCLAVLSCTPPAAVPVDTTADEIVNAYDENIVGGKQRFEGKEVIISGTVFFVTDSFGTEVIFDTPGEILFSVAARFRESEKAQIAKLKKQDQIKAQCKVANADKNAERTIINLTDCQIKP